MAQQVPLLQFQVPQAQPDLQEQQVPQADQQEQQDQLVLMAQQVQQDLLEQQVPQADSQQDLMHKSIHWVWVHLHPVQLVKLEQQIISLLIILMIDLKQN
jgi:hypothetical protein